MSANENIKKQLEAIASYDVNNITTRPELGDRNFEDCKSSLKGAVELAIAVKGFDFSVLPDRYQNNLTSALREFQGSVEALRTFNLDGDPTQRRNQLKGQFNNLVTALYDALLPVLTILYLRDTENRQLAADSALAEISKIVEDAKAGLSAIQKAAANAGMAKEAQHFSTQAKEHKTAATWWLGLTVVMVALTVVWGVIALFYLKLPHDASNVEIVQTSIGKLIVLSGLYFGLVWAGRNYRASRHNYVVNKHRENSLSTFEAFVSAAASDEAIKNAVLLQATTSIFAAQPSGYSQVEPEADTPSKIIEITKSFTGKTPV